MAQRDVCGFVYPSEVADYLEREVFAGGGTVLDLGCGRRKFPGSIGVDAFPGDADVQHDLNRIAYPFADGCARLVVMRHVIEHLDDVVGTLREVARLLQPGGKALVLTPHFSDASSWIDPTHRWHLATRSIEEAAKGCLELRMTYVRLRKLWRRLGFEAWLNGAPIQNRVSRRMVRWENDWCFLVRGGEMCFVLEKPAA